MVAMFLFVVFLAVASVYFLSFNYQVRGKGWMVEQTRGWVLGRALKNQIQRKALYLCLAHIGSSINIPRMFYFLKKKKRAKGDRARWKQRYEFNVIKCQHL